MPTTEITKTTAPGFYSTTGAALTKTAVDTVNDNHVDAVTDLLLIVWNSNAGAQTITITSQADTLTGRSGDVSAQSIAADEIRMFRLTKNGWGDSNDEIQILGSHADVKIMAVNL